MYRYLSITASCDLFFCKVSFLNLPNADKISNFVKNSAKKLRAYCLRMVLKVYKSMDVTFTPVIDILVLTFRRNMHEIF